MTQSSPPVDRQAPGEAKHPALEARRIAKRYDLRRVLRDASVSIHAGQTLLLLGANGAGKTTLLSIIAGRVRQSSGEVAIEGKTLKPGTPVGHLIGIVGHHSMLHVGLSVRENLEWLASCLGVRAARDRVDLLLERFGAKHLAKQSAGKLSRGEGQRCALVRAMLGDPPLLLLDEPFTGLDEAGRIGLQHELHALRESGKAILLTTHETEVGASIATHVELLHAGRTSGTQPVAEASASGGLIERYRASITPHASSAGASNLTSRASGEPREMS